MQVEVIKRFRDKYTGIIYKVGDVLTLTAQRIEEIENVGHFVAVLDVASGVVPEVNDNTENTEKPATDDPVASDGLESMSARELRDYAKEKYDKTFKANMKKADILEAIRGMEHGD